MKTNLTLVQEGILSSGTKAKLYKNNLNNGYVIEFLSEINIIEYNKLNFKISEGSILLARKGFNMFDIKVFADIKGSLDINETEITSLCKPITLFSTLSDRF